MTLEQPRPGRPAVAIVIGVAVVCAGAARAQTSSDLQSSMSPNRGGSAQERPVIGASDLRAAIALPYALTHAVNRPAPSRTEVDYSFSPHGVTGQLGYLCGIDVDAPGTAQKGGPASSFGHGTTFLGAKLVYPFR